MLNRIAVVVAFGLTYLLGPLAGNSYGQQVPKLIQPKLVQPQLIQPSLNLPPGESVLLSHSVGVEKEDPAMGQPFYPPILPGMGMWPGVWGYPVPPMWYPSPWSWSPWGFGPPIGPLPWRPYR